MCFFIYSNIVKNVEKKNVSHNEPIAYFYNPEVSADNSVSEDDNFCWKFSNFESRNIFIEPLVNANNENIKTDLEMRIDQLEMQLF